MNPVNSTAFGEAIKARREERRLTQEDVALSAGVGVRFIHDLEHGKPTAELELALRVAAALGLALRIDDRYSQT